MSERRKLPIRWLTLAELVGLLALVIARVVQAAWTEVQSLDDTARGVGGFGSTGR